MKLETHGRHIDRRAFPSARTVLTLYLCMWLAGCGEIQDLQSPEPRAGLLHHQHLALIPVPGGVQGAMVNPMGGNLFVPRLDSTIPTTLGYNEEIFSAYNSASGEWRFNFDVSFDGSTFVDASAAVHEGLDSIPDGTDIPGTNWGKVDSSTIRSDGGLQYVFGPDGSLVEKHANHQACPKIRYERSETRLLIKQIGCSPRSGNLNEVLLYTLTYEGNRVDALTDRAGHTTSYEYDSVGRLTTVRSAEDVALDRPGVRYEYQHLTGRLTAITNSEGNRVEYSYYTPTAFSGERLRLVTQIGEGNPQYRFTYYGDGGSGTHKTLLENPMGEVSRFLFDDQLRILEVEFDAVQERERFTYSSECGSELRPASYIAANQNETFFTYEGDDIATRTEPSGNVVTIRYAREANSRGAHSLTPLSSIEDSLGLVTSRGYLLPYFQLGEIINGEGERSVLNWGDGTNYTQLESVVSPGGTFQEFREYNLLGQPTKISHGASGGFLETQSFDLVGNITQGSGSSLPESGGIKGRFYDANRNPSVVTIAGQDALGEITSESATAITYRSDGQVLCVDRSPAGFGSGPDHCFTYDDLGRLKTKAEFVDGRWEEEVYGYDASSRRISSERANGMSIERDFDQRGRLVSKRALRNGMLEGELILTYQNGALVSTYDSLTDGTEHYSRDFAGRIETITYSGGETLSYEYDLRSRVRSETYRQSDSSFVRKIGYEYDLADRIVRVFDDDEPIVEYSFVDGRLAGVWTGNNLERDFQYDPEFGFKTGSTTKDLDSGGEIVENTTFTHEMTSDPATWKVSSNTIATGLAGGIPEAWATQENHEIGPGTDPGVPGSHMGKRIIASDNGIESRGYAWDEFSNRVSHGAETFDYNLEANRLNFANVVAADGQEVALSYAYDASGFAVERSGKPVTWNAMGLVTSHGPETFEWDMQRRLLSSDDGTVRRDWSRWGGKIEVDGDGYLVALDLGSVILRLGGAAERYYRHADYRGNVQFVSNDAGEIVTLIEYTPFGVGFVHGAESAVNFAGRFAVGDGLLIVGGRVLDTLIGRFLSPDPVFSLPNQYSYTFGNPIWFNDRSGRHPEVNAGGVAATQTGVSTAVAVGGFIVAAAGVAAIFVPIAPGAAAALAIADLAIATIGLVITLKGAGAPGKSLPSADAGNGIPGCECTKRLELGPSESADDVGAITEASKPSGAAAAGSGASSMGVGVGGAGGGSIGGIGGGIAPACGLQGIEILPLLYFSIRRRRTRS